MAVTFTFTPDKDVYDENEVLLFNSKWLAAWNPIVFKLTSDLFPTNTADTSDIYSSVDSDGGRARLFLYSVADASIYVRGAQITVTGTEYNGVYTVLKYDPIQGRVTIDATYTATDSGTTIRYYTNYVVKLLVSAGLPSGHKWEALKPMVDIETLTQRPNDSGLCTFDISKSVQTKISTENDLTLVSLPNDINLWTAFEVEAHQEYMWFVGTDLTVQETVSSTQSNGGYMELAIPTPNDFNVGDWVKLSSTTDTASNAVIRIISKNTTTGDITIDCDYDAYVDITIVTKYDTKRRVLDSGYNTEGNTYYAHNAKLPFNEYGSNLAQYLNIDGNTASNLSSFTSRMSRFADRIHELDAIIDKTLTDSLGANDFIALEVIQYDQNNTELSTDYFTVTNQEEGIYRFFYGGEVQSTIISIYSLDFFEELTALSFEVTNEFASSEIVSPFTYINTANLTYQYNPTDTWGSPEISTTSIATFNTLMLGKDTGYIRITTSQTSFWEGGVMFYVYYKSSTPATTSLSITLPARRINQSIVLYTTDFQITSLSSSQAGDIYRWGVFTDDAIAADWGVLSNETALSSLTSVNASLNTTTEKALMLFFDEGTANTATASKTITINGTFATGNNSIGGILGSMSDYDFRTALNNNAKIYDGSVDYDQIVTGWTHLPATQAFTFLCVVTISSLAQDRPIFNTNISTTHRITASVLTTGLVRFRITRSSSAVELSYTTDVKCKIGKNIIIICYDGTAASGGTSSTNIYVNGVASNNPTVTNTLSSTLNTSNTISLGYQASASSYFQGNIKKIQFVNVNYNANKAFLRKAFVLGQLDSLVNASEWIMDVDFNQTSTNELTISKGVAMIGAITAVANNGSGQPRFTTSATVPPNGATVIISGTTSYNTATTGAVITRISATQFDIVTQVYVASETGTWKVRIVASGGAAYQDFYTS